MYTIKAAKEAIKNGIEIYLNKDYEGNYLMDEVNRLPFYLEGCPGIGKTQIVKQVADELGIGYVSFSLTHHTRNSLLGLPVIKNMEDGKYTEYTMSEIIAKVIEAKHAGAEEGILLLDEFSCVSESILPAMLGFLQTKNIGTHTLPEGWVIVLCGNPPQYNRNARKFDAVILDRIRKIPVEFDEEVFLEYAKEIHIHPSIYSYLKVFPSGMYRCENVDGELQLVTCRGWENLSHALYGMEAFAREVDEEMVGQFIKSNEVVREFMRMYRMNRIGICQEDMSAVIAGKDIDKYVSKYTDIDDSIWWESVNIFAGLICDKHKEIIPDVQILSLGGELIDELEGKTDIYQQIEERLNSNPASNIDTIPRWCRDSAEYMECSDIESELLKEWQQVLTSEWIFDAGDDDNMTFLKAWYDSLENELRRELKGISKEISNVFKFLSAKDEVFREAFYQEINHSELLLFTMTKTKNKDYISICKDNYAVGA